MLNILPGHKFLSLQFLLGYLFVLCKLRFWSETVCPFQSGSVQCGRSESSCVCVCTSALSAVGSVPHFRSFVPLDVLDDQRIYIYTLKFIIAFCIFKHVQQKFTLLGTNPVSSPTVWPGHTLPTPPLWGQNGTHCFCKGTSFGCLVASWTCIRWWPGQLH